MRYICSECGSDIPLDLDFCKACGSLKSKAISFNDDATAILCQKCGATISPYEISCNHCGEPVDRKSLRYYQPKMRKFGWIGIALAAIPGIGGVFGIGYLYFRKWKKALFYLLITGGIIYLNDGLLIGIEDNLLIGIFAMGIYFIQFMEAIALAYAP